MFINGAHCQLRVYLSSCPSILSFHPTFFFCYCYGTTWHNFVKTLIAGNSQDVLFTCHIYSSEWFLWANEVLQLFNLIRKTLDRKLLIRFSWLLWKRLIKYLVWSLIMWRVVTSKQFLHRLLLLPVCWYLEILQYSFYEENCCQFFWTPMKGNAHLCFSMLVT